VSVSIYYQDQVAAKALLWFNPVLYSAHVFVKQWSSLFFMWSKYWSKSVCVCVCIYHCWVLIKDTVVFRGFCYWFALTCGKFPVSRASLKIPSRWVASAVRARTRTEDSGVRNSTLEPLENGKPNSKTHSRSRWDAEIVLIQITEIHSWSKNQ